MYTHTQHNSWLLPMYYHGYLIMSWVLQKLDIDYSPNIPHSFSLRFKPLAPMNTAMFYLMILKIRIQVSTLNSFSSNLDGSRFLLPKFQLKISYFHANLFADIESKQFPTVKGCEDATISIPIPSICTSRLSGVVMALNPHESLRFLQYIDHYRQSLQNSPFPTLD